MNSEKLFLSAKETQVFDQLCFFFLWNRILGFISILYFIPSLIRLDFVFFSLKKFGKRAVKRKLLTLRREWRCICNMNCILSIFFSGTAEDGSQTRCMHNWIRRNSLPLFILSDKSCLCIYFPYKESNKVRSDFFVFLHESACLLLLYTFFILSFSLPFIENLRTAHLHVTWKGRIVWENRKDFV